VKALVLGAGLQGCACALDLLTTSELSVTLADRVVGDLPPFLEGQRGPRLALATVDAGDRTALRGLVAGHALVLSALPYYLNAGAAEAALESGAHYADLGGNTGMVRQLQARHDAAAARGVSLVPDCGVAPGLVNVLAAEGLRRMDDPHSVRLYVGGLPQRPSPPLNYSIVYSLEGVLDYYTTPAAVLRGGEVTEVPALSELEEIDFPSVGRLEAFHTAGGASTMPYELAGRVDTLEYKTLRYPGHAAIMEAIRELGLLDQQPVTVRGQPVIPREVFIAVVDRILRRREPDLIALRVIVAGRRAAKPARVVFELLDRYDDRLGVSAMMRTTAYSLSITGQLQLAGAIPPGVQPAWRVTPFGPYIEALARRGVSVQEKRGRATGRSNRARR
jgi:lysine 6-dehydrogenase